MKKGLVGSIATLITSAGLSFAEPPLAMAPAASLPAVTTAGQAPAGQTPVGQTPAGQTPLGGDIAAPSTCASGDCFAAAKKDCDCGIWFTAEYLMWWIKDSPMPVPLMTTGTNGILGDQNTSVVLGGNDIENGMRHGGRLSMGYWLDSEHNKAIEINGFFLGKRFVDQSATHAGAGDPALFVPFLFAEVNPPVEATLAPENIADSFVGMVSVSSFLFGSDANALLNVAKGDGWRFDLLGGFRYLQLQEDSSFIVGAGSASGDTIAFRDQFNTRNRFFGGQIGGRFDYTQGKFFVTATGKVALGNMHQTVDITGVTAETDNGVTTITSGGIFAQASNIGHHSRNDFAVIPEVTINVAAQLTDYCRAFVGYNFLYVSNVLRPGDQIDRQVNLTQSPLFGDGTLVGAARPMVLNHDNDFWAQGVNFGLALSW